MAGDKYLKVNSTGDAAEQAAVQSSAGAANAGNIVALNASGLIDTTMLAETVSKTVQASENLAAGAYVNIWSSAGSLRGRNADASSGLRAHGFVLAAILSGASGPVIEGNGVNSSLSGLTIGTEYFLSAVGAVTSIVPAAGNLLQHLGVAVSATELDSILGGVIQR